MKLGSLKRKVIKEFEKSPAKTMFLLAICPVALYFVVPLFLPKKSRVNPSQRAKVIATNVVPSMSALAIDVPASSVGQSPTWQQLNGWIEADWRRKSGSIAADERNPFQSAATETDETVAVPVTPPMEVVALPAFSQEAFAALDLRLTGTLLGHHSRSATINGRRYLEGAMVTPMPSEGLASSTGPTFVLKHVGARHAVLEMDGLRFRLDLDAGKPLGNGITVVRRPANALE